jgi:hypothetical protein
MTYYYNHGLMQLPSQAHGNSVTTRSACSKMCILEHILLQRAMPHPCIPHPGEMAWHAHALTSHEWSIACDLFGRKDTPTYLGPRHE